VLCCRYRTKPEQLGRPLLHCARKTVYGVFLPRGAFYLSIVVRGDDADVVQKDMSDGNFQHVRNTKDGIIDKNKGFFRTEVEMMEHLNNDVPQLGGSGWCCVRTVDRDAEWGVAVCDEGTLHASFLVQNGFTSFGE